MRSTGRHSRWLVVAALATLAGCGTDWGLLVTVRCDQDADPTCSLAIPSEVDSLRVNLTQPSVNPPPLDRIYSLEQGDAFPLSISVVAGDGAREGAVVAKVDALLGQVVVADGTASGPLREGRQVEIVVSLRPL